MTSATSTTDHLPRIEAVRDQVDDDLRASVAEARRREISWERIGDSLGMKRQSAWERFAELPVRAEQP